jgi:uncharacterized repeat protein (TIGR01451 family)
MGAGGVVSVNNRRVTAGLSLKFVVEVTNNGPWDALSTELEDRLPAGVVVTRVSPTQGTCRTGTPGDAQDPLRCGLGKISKGHSVTVKIFCDVLPSVAGGTLLENDAYVTSTTIDPTNTYNFGHTLTEVTAWADLLAQKAQVPMPAEVGEEVNYTVTIMNHGPSDALWSEVTDDMPDQLGPATWTCTAFGGAKCGESGSDDIYQSVDLPAGGRVVYKVKAVREKDGGPLVNTAIVSAPDGVNDPDPSNNRASTSNHWNISYLPMLMKNAK